VAWALRPDDFAHGEDRSPERPFPPGEGWRFDELQLSLEVHPAHLLDADDDALRAIWLAWRSGGGLGGGVGHLPFAGGSAEQPACVMAALAIMDNAAARLAPKRRSANGVR